MASKNLINHACRITLLSIIITRYAAGDFATDCPSECTCIWSSGSKAANCSDRDIKIIPGKLSNDIQNLDLSENPLYEITVNAFDNVGLINLKKLILSNCRLITIHKDGLTGLGILTSLDISRNNLKSLHIDTFRELTKIKWIFLNDNKLEKLEDGLFKDLEFLQKVEISNNNLLRIGLQAFQNLPKLSTLMLNGNNVTHMQAESLNHLTALLTLDLDDNPWRCDCHLQAFRNWAIKRFKPQATCADPPTLAGKHWNDLDSKDFACKPNILLPLSGFVVRTSDMRVTLSCKVAGNPLPEVSWILNGKYLNSGIWSHGDQKYSLKESSHDLIKWVNLTIFDAGSSDNGDYSCVAKNNGGIDERFVKLIQSGPGVVGAGGVDNETMSIIIGLICGVVVLLLIAVFVCYCYCRKRDKNKQKSSTSGNGDALIEGSVIPELEKSFVSSVNPVTKPPRKYEAPSITSAATEMSDLNKTLLDNDSVFAGPEEDAKSQERHYPPDLLAFPPRTAVSPSTTAYINPALFRTLPYSRSHSPAPIPVNPIISPRRGYVTIPRRPRAPSWASYLPPSDTQEPIYDNLGLRTTADGSSALSLNKAGVENPYSPMRNRPLPTTPISELPGVQRPMPRTRITSTPDKNKIMSTDTINMSAIDNSSLGPLNSRLSLETNSSNRSPVKDLKETSSLLNDTVSLPSGTLNRSGKIPPRPPPKPKKKPVTANDSSQPLFEDEGEDGTEV